MSLDCAMATLDYRPKTAVHNLPNVVYQMHNAQVLWWKVLFGEIKDYSILPAQKKSYIFYLFNREFYPRKKIHTFSTANHPHLNLAKHPSVLHCCQTDTNNIHKLSSLRLLLK